MRRFDQIDVFCQVGLGGNPVAVVHDAGALSAEQMQTLARWTNLSETAFLLPPSTEGAASGADYRVRIFAPAGELAFAGHPTIGSARAWLLAGGLPRGGHIIQECGVGLVKLRHDHESGLIGFEAPALSRCEPADAATIDRVCAALGIESKSIQRAAWLRNGPTWLSILVEDAEQVLSLEPDFAAMGELAVGIIAPIANAEAARFEMRAFAPSLGIDEDPVTGSLAAAMARWLVKAGLLPQHTTIRQGTRLQRRGIIHLDVDGDHMWISGHTTPVITGSIEL